MKDKDPSFSVCFWGLSEPTLNTQSFYQLFGKLVWAALLMFGE